MGSMAHSRYSIYLLSEWIFLSVIYKMRINPPERGQVIGVTQPVCHRAWLHSSLNLRYSKLGAFPHSLSSVSFLFPCLRPQQLTTFQIYDKCLNIRLCLFFFFDGVWLTPRCLYFQPPWLFWINRKHSFKEDPAHSLYLLSRDAYLPLIKHLTFLSFMPVEKGVYHTPDQNMGRKFLSLRKNQPRLPPGEWLAKVSGIEAPWHLQNSR